MARAWIWRSVKRPWMLSCHCLSCVFSLHASHILCVLLFAPWFDDLGHYPWTSVGRWFNQLCQGTGSVELRPFFLPSVVKTSVQSLPQSNPRWPSRSKLQPDKATDRPATATSLPLLTKLRTCFLSLNLLSFWMVHTALQMQFLPILSRNLSQNCLMTAKTPFTKVRNLTQGKMTLK